MTALSSYVRDKAAQKPITLMTHIVVGYPSLEANWQVLQQMEAAGVEVVEFQFPFSEPVADGPLFAQANQASLDAGTTLAQCFELVERAAKTFSFKILMMGYYNTVFKMGEEAFCRRLSQAGATGMIIADVTVEESADLRRLAAAEQLAFVHLVTPTTPESRVAMLADEINAGDALVYVVARKGTTGKSTDFAALDSYIAMLRRYIHQPLALGFGISTRDDVQSLVGKVDMAILGTQVLRVLEKDGVEAVGTFLRGLRA